MDMYSIIEKKRDGKKLTKEEVNFFVSGFTKGDIPDYQASAFLMAVFIRGIDREETEHLTMAMRDSGDVADMSSVPGLKVDKHSTGGVGDKTTLIVGPIAAACGVPIAKMSGRGLGFTGGTVDKLESIPGFKTVLEREEFTAQVSRIGLAVIGQSGHIAPADKKLYALRDVTATVDNLSLICSSIMSKKLASGSDAIVLDVKTGSGAFMKDLDEAVKLAKLMTEMGKAAGKTTVAAVTDMSQPLGLAVGNTLEVIEAAETLKGRGPGDITELSIILSGIMIYVGDKASSPEEGSKMAQKVLDDGSALQKFKEFIEAQGGDPRVAEDYSLLPQHSFSEEILADCDGYVEAIAAREIGLASQHTGAGRETKEDLIDLSAGILLNKKVGDRVACGEKLAEAFGTDRKKVLQGAEEAKAAFKIGTGEVKRPKLIKEFIGF